LSLSIEAQQYCRNSPIRAISLYGVLLFVAMCQSRCFGRRRAFALRILSVIVATFTVASCGIGRADYLSEVNGALLPCRDVGRVHRLVPTPPTVSRDAGALTTTIELTQNGRLAEMVLVVGRPPGLVIGRRAKICDKAFLVIGRTRSYPIL
jgi:hypothetical protein